MSTPIGKLFDLSGKTALVTGGSRGLGLQIAQALGESGARVMLISRKAAELEATTGTLRAQGMDAHCMAADASQPAEITRVAEETMRAFGQIDILVN
ncbi:MAG: SDR family NAD(P)-dependent oxidoreductase, partial [Burkholderiaceae bacterium]|nr:SDR family NAD(P)-dependent oxidoreductase [Burkholderiaceae bacterium]